MENVCSQKCDCFCNANFSLFLMTLLNRASNAQALNHRVLWLWWRKTDAKKLSENSGKICTAFGISNMIAFILKYNYNILAPTFSTERRQTLKIREIHDVIEMWRQLLTNNTLFWCWKIFPANLLAKFEVLFYFVSYILTEVDRGDSLISGISIDENA